MPTPTFKALNPHAQAVFDHLTKDLAIGRARKIDNAGPPIMAVCIDRVTARHYAIAHYYEQNSDLMADPSMTFFKCAHGKVFACTFQQDNLGVYRVGLDITPEGVIEHESVREQHDQAEFANLWLRNIAEQQQLPIALPEEDAR